MDGFAEKGHRGLMQFMLIPENGPEFFQYHGVDPFLRPTKDSVLQGIDIFTQIERH